MVSIDTIESGVMTKDLYGMTEMSGKESKKAVKPAGRESPGDDAEGGKEDGVKVGEAFFERESIAKTVDSDFGKCYCRTVKANFAVRDVTRLIESPGYGNRCKSCAVSPL